MYTSVYLCLLIAVIGFKINLHNSSCHAKAEFNNCVIIHSNISNFSMLAMYMYFAFIDGYM